MEHPIGNLMQTTLENLKDMVDVNTVVGEPIAAMDGSTVIPISKVSFGFVTGGGEYTGGHLQESGTRDKPFAGGSGAGVSVQPVGFLVIGENGVKMLPAQSLTALERALNCAPQVMEDIKSLLGGKHGGKQEKIGADGQKA